jgi:hypothetical protein
VAPGSVHGASTLYRQPSSLTVCPPDGSGHRSAGWTPSQSPAEAGWWLCLRERETILVAPPDMFTEQPPAQLSPPSPFRHLEQMESHMKILVKYTDNHENAILSR